MSYIKRLNHAFKNVPTLAITPNTKYVFFSDCHRGIGNNNDNFLKNENSYFAALQYYYQYDFCYIEVGDGDELWENKRISQITEMHDDIFNLLSQFNNAGRLYMLYGNHDMIKKYNKASFDDNIEYLEGIILKSGTMPKDLYVTHGHQADFFNSVLWRLARFLVRYLWSPLEYFGFLDPTSAAKNNTKRNRIEQRLIHYAKSSDCLLLTGHTHKPTLGNDSSNYYNCGSCVHPKSITCIELCGYNINLVKWYMSTKSQLSDNCDYTKSKSQHSFDYAEKDGHHRNMYGQRPPEYPVYIKREVIASQNILTH